MSSYTSEDIVVLEPAEAVRMRPKMYLGRPLDRSTNTTILSQFFCVAADAAFLGRPVRLDVTINQAGVATVEDDGPGLPILRMKGQWFPELVVTSLHCACAAHRVSKEIEAELCSPGIGVAAAVTAWLELETRDGERRYRQRFVRGRPEACAIEACAAPSGLRYHFALDPSVLPDTGFDHESIQWRLAGLNRMIPQLDSSLKPPR